MLIQREKMGVEKAQAGWRGGRERERKTETESGMEGGRVSMRKEINNKRVIFKELHILTERFYSFM